MKLTPKPSLELRFDAKELGRQYGANITLTPRKARVLRDPLDTFLKMTTAK